MEFMLGKRFTGSAMGAVTLRRDIPKYMDMYRKGMVDIDSMLTRYFPLEQINEAFDDYIKNGAVKNVIVVGGVE
jgi:Zn-dependent alcohol dehydrogenase